MVSFSGGFEFFITSPNIGMSSFTVEGISGIEEEPLGFIWVFKVNI
jgi:hypothetical protein